MNTFTIDELDREEIEFLPPRVVMTTCSPNPCCRPRSCAPAIQLYLKVQVGCLVRCEVVAS